MSLQIPETQSAIYQASWPRSMEPTFCKEAARVAWDILSIVIFPIGLLRLANHYIIRPLLLRSVVLPALKYAEGWLVIENKREFKTASGELIEGFFIEGKKNHNKLVIFVGGNGMHCERVQDMNHLVESGCSILAINPMGVGGSEGYPGTNGMNFEESLALPVFSAYEYAREQLGYHAEDICLYGFSLGGVATTLGAELIQEKYGPAAVKLVNDRSLGSISKVAVAWGGSIGQKIAARLRKNPFSSFSTFGKVMKCLAHIVPDCVIRLIVRLAVALFGLQADAEKAFLNLKTKEKCIVYYREDGVIPYREGAALYTGVRSRSEHSRIRLRENMDHDHCNPFADLEEQYVIGQLHEFLGIESEERNLLATSYSTDKIFRRSYTAGAV